MITIDDLPRNILQVVFLQLNDITGGHKYLLQLSLVCKKWKDALCIKNITFYYRSSSSPSISPSRFFSLYGEHIQSVLTDLPNVLPELIENCPRLTHLKANCFYEEDAENLASILKNHQLLNSLELTLCSHSFPILFSCLPPKSSLLLWGKEGNNITRYEIAQLIADNLSQLPSLTFLGIRSVPLDKVDLTGSLPLNVPTVDFLDSKITPQFGFNLIALDKNLTKLSLQRTRSEDEHLKEIMCAMESNSTITSLDLSENHFTKADYIANMLLKNKTLTYLNLTRNYFEHFEVLFLSLLRNNIIQLILLDTLGIDEATYAPDLEVLKKCLPRIGGRFVPRVKQLFKCLNE